jgi:hypothetical protein
MKFRIVATVSAAALALAAAIGCAGGATPDSSTPIVTVTSEQASPTGKPVSAEQSNANRAAADYLNGQAFSRKGLIEQLSSDAGEGYPVKVATAAVDSLHVDWNAQAALSAQDYLKGQAFSRKGLIEQLEYEGFSHAQAVYGVTKAGLQ